MDWSRLPSLSQLRAFEAAARGASFSAAARELNVTPAAIGQQVRALEREIGSTLIERVGRGMVPTEVGRELADALSRAFGTIADAVERASADAAARPVRVTMTPMFASYWFMPRYGDFRTRYPQHDLVVHPTGAIVDIAAGAADVAVRYGDGAWDGLEASLLQPSDFVIVGGPDLLPADFDVTPKDLLSLPWFEELGSQEIWRWFQSVGLDVGARAKVTEVPGHLIRELLREGHGLATAARVFVADDLATGRLRVYWEAERPSGGYWVVHRPGPQREGVTALVDWLRVQAGQKKGRLTGRPSPTGR